MSSAEIFTMSAKRLGNEYSLFTRCHGNCMNVQPPMWNVYVCAITQIGGAFQRIYTVYEPGYSNAYKIS